MKSKVVGTRKRNGVQRMFEYKYVALATYVIACIVVVFAAITSSGYFSTSWFLVGCIFIVSSCLGLAIQRLKHWTTWLFRSFTVTGLFLVVFNPSDLTSTTMNAFGFHMTNQVLRDPLIFLLAIPIALIAIRSAYPRKPGDNTTIFPLSRMRAEAQSDFSHRGERGSDAVKDLEMYMSPAELLALNVLMAASRDVPEDRIVDSFRSEVYAQYMILRELKRIGAPATRWELQKRLKPVISMDTVYRHCKILYDAGFIQVDGAGEQNDPKYKPTELGEEFMALVDEYGVKLSKYSSLTNRNIK